MFLIIVREAHGKSLPFSGLYLKERECFHAAGLFLLFPPNEENRAEGS